MCSSDLPKQVSEAYHKAKADGSNPELVAAVEELLNDKELQQKLISLYNRILQQAKNLQQIV